MVSARVATARVDDWFGKLPLATLWVRPVAQCLTGTAQPPLPLHEFLPAQPLSPDLQPP